jgi:hypothetical protein
MNDAVYPNAPFFDCVKDKIILHDEETISQMGQSRFIGDFPEQRMGGKAG